MAIDLDEIARAVLSMRDEDLPTGAKSLVLAAQCEIIRREREPRRSYHFMSGLDLPKADRPTSGDTHGN